MVTHRHCRKAGCKGTQAKADVNRPKLGFPCLGPSPGREQVRRNANDHLKRNHNAEHRIQGETIMRRFIQ